MPAALTTGVSVVAPEKMVPFAVVHRYVALTVVELPLRLTRPSRLRQLMTLSRPALTVGGVKPAPWNSPELVHAT